MRTFGFALDPFQEAAIACLHKRESVLVSAHTSAGKTVVAQYAMAMAMQANQRVIYTTPIKALSNQKFRDLGEAFEGVAASIGLMTGDVTVNPDATCLVMTTEILRSMLYRGADEMREVAWVVFDEVHYLRDKERGVVWEESIVLLPPSIKLVFLSATIPNAREFAQWVAELKRSPCHVISTDYRPTPLQHYMFPSGGQGLYLVLDEGGEFLEDNFMRMTAAMHESKAGGGGKAGGARRGHQGPPDIHKVVKSIADQHLEPAIVFAFSRKECEALALQLQRSGKFTLTTAEEQQAIRDVYTQALECLSSDDQALPQIQMMLPLLLQGFGVHHSGLLPILRELIEILFQEGLLRVLFATETFALGLNMPARTCVFTNCRKFDGREHRWITCSEYIQMAGRAGRRGIDDKGFVITMFDEQLDPEIARSIVSGQSDPLCSTFHLTYNMLLNATRNSGGDQSLSPEAVISRSFHHFQSGQAALRQRLGHLKERIARRDGGKGERDRERARARASASGAAGEGEEPAPGAVGEGEERRRDAEAFLDLVELREELEGELAAHLRQPEICLRYLSPGRVVRVVEGGGGRVAGGARRLPPRDQESRDQESRDQESRPAETHGARAGGLDWGWGAVVGFARKGEGSGGGGELEDGEVAGNVGEQARSGDGGREGNARDFVVYVLLAAREEDGVGERGGRKRKVQEVVCGDEEEREEKVKVQEVVCGDESAAAGAGADGNRGGRRIVGGEVEPCDWQRVLLQGVAGGEGPRAAAGREGAGAGAGEGGMQAGPSETGGWRQAGSSVSGGWQPVILPLELSAIRGISSVRLPLPARGRSLDQQHGPTAPLPPAVTASATGASYAQGSLLPGARSPANSPTRSAAGVAAGHGGGGGGGESGSAAAPVPPPCDLRAADQQRSMMQSLFGAVRFFGAEREREWERAMPPLEALVADHSDAHAPRAGCMHAVFRQWQQVDVRLRASSWHSAYASLVGLQAPVRGVGKGGEGEEEGRLGRSEGAGAVTEDVEVLKECWEVKEMKRQVALLQEKLRAVGGGNHSFVRELKGRMRVLRRLGYITDAGVVTLKGRAACEVEMLQDLVVVEMMLQGGFSELTPPQVAAVCSCLVVEEKDDSGHEQEVKLHKTLALMRDCASEVRSAKVEAGLELEGGEEACNTSIMDVVHMWCDGSSFADVCARSKVWGVGCRV